MSEMTTGSSNDDDDCNVVDDGNDKLILFSDHMAS